MTTDIPTTLFWRSLFGGLCVVGVTVIIGGVIILFATAAYLALQNKRQPAEL